MLSRHASLARRAARGSHALRLARLHHRLARHPLGAAGAWNLAGLVGGLFFDVQPHDPAVYLAAFALLAATGLAAAFLPARRAARVDPLVALRMD